MIKHSEIASEVKFQIPPGLAGKFKEFFERFDQDLDGLGMRSYGISEPTLEDVFIRVTNNEESSI